MTRDPRRDLLFEPLKIGLVTTKNRLYQVPHCTGRGNFRPLVQAHVHGMKSEGGWGVVHTEYNFIHLSSDDTPRTYGALAGA
jgi:dimethylamine/trimethylamine dehydrogenase